MPSSKVASNVASEQQASCSNLVVLRGVVSADITDRTLPSGSVAAQFDVKTPHTSVNVSWIDPPVEARSWVVPGEAIVVIGTVQRRFFRVGGATQSRTEVVADQVIPARRARSARSAIADAARSLGD